MVTWTLGSTHPTSDPRVRVGCWAGSTWRTIVQDDPGADWAETGPPYPSKDAALAAVDSVLLFYFGTAQDLDEHAASDAAKIARLERIIELLNAYGQAMNGDQWWPGNARACLTDGRGAELEQLLGSQP